MNSDHRPKRRRAEPPPSNNPAAWLTLGTIVAPFGIRGEVKLFPDTDFPERVGDHDTLYLGPERRPTRLRAARVHGPHVLLTLEGVADMTAAETLRGQLVSIPLAAAAPLAPNQYYIHDLIGLRAVHRDGTDLGVVADVVTNRAQDLLIVRRRGRPDVYVPLVKALVPAVDVAAGTVTLDPPLGLFDDDAVEG